MLPAERIEQAIFLIRGHKVLLDVDLVGSDCVGEIVGGSHQRTLMSQLTPPAADR